MGVSLFLPDRYALKACTAIILILAVFISRSVPKEIKTGKEKARFTSELRTDELDSYAEEKISEKQKTIQAEASFWYTDSAEGFGVTSVFEFTSQNGKYIITGWKMPDPPNDDSNF